MNSSREFQTKKLLKLISEHLSSRECCKGEEYTLILSDDYSSGYSFSMNVSVFPDRYHRHESDKDTVISHILNNHMLDIKSSDGGIDLLNVIPGTYVYKLSTNGRRRKWIPYYNKSL